MTSMHLGVNSSIQWMKIQTKNKDKFCKPKKIGRRQNIVIERPSQNGEAKER